MIIPNQLIPVKWSKLNKDHFTEKGYVFTKVGEEFHVNPNELSKGSSKKIYCYCDNCNKTIQKVAKVAFVTKKHFCNKQCKSEYQKGQPSPNNTRKKVKCDYCDKSFLVKNYIYVKLLEGKQKNVFCSKECTGKWNSKNRVYPNTSIIKKCSHCNAEYSISLHRKNKTKFCSAKCRQLNSRNRIKAKCEICGMEFSTTPSQVKKSKSGKLFCSNACVGKYNAEKRTKKIKKVCNICLVGYEVIPAHSEKSVTCSKECQNKWQSLFLTGENSNRFDKTIPIEKRKFSCEWCGKIEIARYPSLLKTSKKKFCSQECRRNWFAKSWSQQETWKKESRIRAVKILSSGLISKTSSECQTIVNSLLSKMNIETINEYNIKYYSIDNFLPQTGLFIEVMGTYWHADPRKYKSINYKMQYNRIIKDNHKRLSVKALKNTDILYLWEDDIHNNLELVEKVVELYVQSGGLLKNFHSFNYSLINNGVCLNQNIIRPYMDYSLTDLKNITSFDR
ncbi:hypothetical protein ABEQ76_05505 [Bacillus velezensis]